MVNNISMIKDAPRKLSSTFRKLVTMGIKALRLRRQKPDRFGGKWLAIMGIILGSIPIVFSFIGLTLCLFGHSDICTNMGLWFLA